MVMASGIVCGSIAPVDSRRSPGQEARSIGCRAGSSLIQLRVVDKSAGALDKDIGSLEVHTAPMSHTGRPHPDVRALQAPLRVAYARDPAEAAIVDLAWTDGADNADPMSGRVHFGSHATSSIGYGVHRAIGGTHVAPVPGDLLCAALASCQESSLRMVANVLGVRLVKLRVAVRAKVDVRGTLGMNALVPVGFQSMLVNISLQPAPGTHPLRVSQLIRSAERACVVLQTLRAGVPVTTEIDLSQPPDEGATQ